MRSSVAISNPGSAVEMLGNADLFDLHKTAFLCSRKVPAAQVLKCYDRAIAMRDAGKCVMLGAHSQLERDVLHYLLKGAQPIVVVLARGMKKRLDGTLSPEIAKGRLPVVAPLTLQATRVTEKTAALRNLFMLDKAQEVVLGHVDPDGSLAKALAERDVTALVL